MVRLALSVISMTYQVGQSPQHAGHYPEPGGRDSQTYPRPHVGQRHVRPPLVLRRTVAVLVAAAVAVVLLVGLVVVVQVVGVGALSAAEVTLRRRLEVVTEAAVEAEVVESRALEF